MALGSAAGAYNTDVQPFSELSVEYRAMLDYKGRSLGHEWVNGVDAGHSCDTFQHQAEAQSSQQLAVFMRWY